jgi:hypothetical protein
MLGLENIGSKTNIYSCSSALYNVVAMIAPQDPKLGDDNVNSK